MAISFDSNSLYWLIFYCIRLNNINFSGKRTKKKKKKQQKQKKKKYQMRFRNECVINTDIKAKQNPGREI